MCICSAHTYTKPVTDKLLSNLEMLQEWLQFLGTAIVYILSASLQVLSLYELILFISYRWARKYPHCGWFLLHYTIIGMLVYTMDFIDVIPLDMDVVYNIGDAINKIAFGLVIYNLAVSK